MSKYKCIIFDCDGVLVDSELIGNQVLVEMANELGVNIDIEYALKHFKGNSLERCFAQVEKLATEPLPENFESYFRRRSFEVFKNEIKPVDGIAEVLENLKIPFCVASSGPINKIKLNLELTGMLDKFENNIFSCYTIKKWKPNPEVFLWAAKSLGFKPEECVVIEDSILGVEAARRGGFDVFGYTAHDYRNELKPIATKVFNNMTDLLSMI